MTKYLTSCNAAFFAAGGFIAALFLGGAAYAITDTAFNYSTPKTGYLAIPTAAFVARYNSDVYSNFGYVLTTSSSTHCFSAPVNLPQGAKMTALAIWYAKNDSDAVAVTLSRQKLSDGTLDTISTLVPVNTSGVRKPANVNITTLQGVDNLHYSYFIEACVSKTEQFYSARIAYTYTDAGD